MGFSPKFVVKFVGHIVIGTLLFAFVALAAIFLHRFMDWILGEGPRVDYISTAIEGVEIFLFAVDLICFVAFIVKETIVLLRELWLDIRHRRPREIRREKDMTKHTLLESVKNEVTNTVASYFAPVKAVIDEVSKAVTTESTQPPKDPDEKKRPPPYPSTNTIRRCQCWLPGNAGDQFDVLWLPAAEPSMDQPISRLGHRRADRRGQPASGDNTSFQVGAHAHRLRTRSGDTRTETPGNGAARAVARSGRAGGAVASASDF